MTTSLSDLGVTFADNTVQPTYAPPTAGMRNRVINGAMKIDQRNSGASQTFTAGGALAYCVDRWYGYCTGANITGQQVAGPIANTYRYKFTGAASNTAVGFGTRLEANDTADLAGSTATLSVKLSSSSLTTITWTAYYATTKDTFGTLGSPTRTQIATGTFTITSTEARYSTQIAMSASATTGVEIVFTGGALLATQTLTIGDVQLELGSVATPIEPRLMQTELSMCQRYWYKYGDSTYAVPGFLGYQAAGTAAATTFTHPVTMRAAPTATKSGTWTATNCSQPSFVANQTSGKMSVTVTALGAFNSVPASGTDYVTFDSEL